jgi:hypothetical protein
MLEEERATENTGCTESVYPSNDFLNGVMGECEGVRILEEFKFCKASTSGQVMNTVLHTEDTLTKERVRVNYFSENAYTVNA